MALVEHRSVAYVRYSDPNVEVEGTHATLFANAMYAIVAANAPALREFSVHTGESPVLRGLIDEAMTDALPRNTHLERIRCMKTSYR